MELYKGLELAVQELNEKVPVPPELAASMSIAISLKRLADSVGMMASISPTLSSLANSNQRLANILDELTNPNGVITNGALVSGRSVRVRT